jgi:hypothetical protein
MPRATLTEELNLIEFIVAAHPGGMGITGIETEMTRRQGSKLNRRTLQRRLQKLIDGERLITEGKSITLVYKLTLERVAPASGSMTPTVTGNAPAEGELYVPVSPEGAAIREQVRRPLMHRRPVGFQRSFLEAYLPGTTFYLPEPLRRQLHERWTSMHSPSRTCTQCCPKT